MPSVLSKILSNCTAELARETEGLPPFALKCIAEFLDLSESQQLINAITTQLDFSFNRLGISESAIDWNQIVQACFDFWRDETDERKKHLAVGNFLSLSIHVKEDLLSKLDEAAFETLINLTLESDSNDAMKKMIDQLDVMKNGALLQYLLVWRKLVRGGASQIEHYTIMFDKVKKAKTDQVTQLRDELAPEMLFSFVQDDYESNSLVQAIDSLLSKDLASTTLQRKVFKFFDLFLRDKLPTLLLDFFSRTQGNTNYSNLLNLLASCISRETLPIWATNLNEALKGGDQATSELLFATCACYFQLELVETKRTFMEWIHTSILTDVFKQSKKQISLLSKVLDGLLLSSSSIFLKRLHFAFSSTSFATEFCSKAEARVNELSASSPNLKSEDPELSVSFILEYFKQHQNVPNKFMRATLYQVQWYHGRFLNDLLAVEMSKREIQMDLAEFLHSNNKLPRVFYDRFKALGDVQMETTRGNESSLSDLVSALDTKPSVSSYIRLAGHLKTRVSENSLLAADDLFALRRLIKSCTQIAHSENCYPAIAEVVATCESARNTAVETIIALLKTGVSTEDQEEMVIDNMVVLVHLIDLHLSRVQPRTSFLADQITELEPTSDPKFNERAKHFLISLYVTNTERIVDWDQLDESAGRIRSILRYWILRKQIKDAGLQLISKVEEEDLQRYIIWDVFHSDGSLSGTRFYGYTRKLVSSLSIEPGLLAQLVSGLISRIGQGCSYDESNFDTIVRAMMHHYHTSFVSLLRMPSTEGRDRGKICSFAQGCLRYMASSRFDPFIMISSDDKEAFNKLFKTLLTFGYSVGPLKVADVECLRFKLIPFLGDEDLVRYGDKYGICSAIMQDSNLFIPPVDQSNSSEGLVPYIVSMIELYDMNSQEILLNCQESGLRTSITEQLVLRLNRRINGRYEVARKKNFGCVQGLTSFLSVLFQQSPDLVIQTLLRLLKDQRISFIFYLFLIGKHSDNILSKRLQDELRSGFLDVTMNGYCQVLQNVRDELEGDIDDTIETFPLWRLGLLQEFMLGLVSTMSVADQLDPHLQKKLEDLDPRLIAQYQARPSTTNGADSILDAHETLFKPGTKKRILKHD